MALFLSPSVSAARISTVLSVRQAGCRASLGSSLRLLLIRKPARLCTCQTIGKFTLNYDSLCRRCQSFFSKQPGQRCPVNGSLPLFFSKQSEPADPLRRFAKPRFIGQQSNAHIPFAVFSKTDAWGDGDVRPLKQQIGKFGG